MSEKAFEVANSEGLKNRGKLFIPVGKGPFPAVVLLHGLTGSFMEYKNLFILRNLAKKGILGVGFNFTHDVRGFSEGNFFDLTMESQIDDANSVLDFVETMDIADKSRIGLCGHSFGGRITEVVGSKRSDLKALAIISSGWNPSQDLLDHLKIKEENWKNKGFATFPPDWMIGDNKLGFGFFQSLRRFNMSELVERIDKPTMVIQGDKDQLIRPETAQIHFNHLNCEKKLVIIKNGDHNFTGKKSLEDLCGTLCNWFTEKL